jgi:O-6-methylguanine DNA methyltransferase
MTIERSRIASPLGPLALAVSDEGLCALDFIDAEPRGRARPSAPPPASARPGASGLPIAERIEAYFAGDVHALDGIPVAPEGTSFQMRVWSALRRIAAGGTCSYQELAAAIGSPSSARAVGAANGANPIPLVVPCHRVIAAGGKLHGYGGGLWRKEWLLRHEGALPPGLPALFDVPGAALDATR